MTQDPRSDGQVPTFRSDQTDVVKLAAALVIVTILIGTLYVGKGVLIPLAIAFLISFVLSPLVNWLARRGLSRLLAVGLVMLTVGIVIAGIGTLVGSQVRTLSAQLPTYQTTIRTKIDSLAQQMRGPGVFDGALETVNTVQKEVTQAVQGSPETAGVSKVEVVPAATSPFQTAKDWLIPALSPLATAGIVLVFVFLVLLDSGDLRDRLLRLMGGNLHRSTDALDEAGTRISKYLLMQIIVNVTYALPLGLGLWYLGVPGWLLWAVFAAFMRFIPYIGSMLSAIFPIGLAFAVDPGWDMVIWTTILIVFLELVSGNIIEPLLYGTTTGLSAISLIAAATFWTALWGPVGLVLSTPLTVCLLVVGRYLPQLQFLETLLGSAPVLDVPTRIYQRLLADDPDDALTIVEDTIEDGDVAGFYSDTGIAVLRQASDDFLGNARAEHRLRVANGMDLLLEDLRADYPPPAAGQTRPRIACIGGKWEVDSIACEMLSHALSLEGLPATERREGALTSRYVDKLDLDGIEIICLSYFSRDPESSIRSFCRRLRQRWPGRKIVLALWNAPETLLDPDQIRALGADEVVASVDEAVRRIARMISPEIAEQALIADAPENDAARVEALLETDILDGHARDELDALAKRAADVFNVRFAVISAIDADREFIVGQSMELPGELTRDGTEMIVMPRDDAICDHVVASGETLVVNDTERDPHFAEHPAIRLWHTRFYAGAPLTTNKGHVLGALCLLDTEPRKLDDEEIELLGTMAADIVAVMTGEEGEVPEPKPEPGSASLGQAVPD
ncbi:AI-2E family transporter [Paracoccus aminophilus]|nr:AI-2E family transporter [Paracoccus aminophilus]